jgi:glycosidase
MEETVEVTLAYKPVISIERINLIGDFNDWDLDANPMLDDNGDGTYEATLSLTPGEYEYKFVVDGNRWQKPTNADYYVEDGFGGKNGVIKVEGSGILNEPSTRGDGNIIFDGLRHDNSEVLFANPLAKDRISIRFQTKRDDVEEVILNYYDGEKRSVKLERITSYDYFDFYKGTINVNSACLEYTFELRDGDRVIYYDKQGPMEINESEKLEKVNPFEYDLSTATIFKTPDWVRGAIIYQIFPDRFYNANPDNDPEKIEIYKDENTLHNAIIPDWDQGVPPSPPVITENIEFYDDNNAIHPKGGHHVFYGGDLQGIQEKLSYIERLGVNVIYLNPIFKATSNHKYNTEGYELVDDTLAIKGDLEASEEYVINLIKKLHNKGIKVIFDAVFNHTGYEHWAFQDIVKNGKESRYVDWYKIRNFPVIPLYQQSAENPPNYDCWWGFGHLPQLNVANPEVKDYIFKVTKKWLDPKGNGDLSAGVDGWRLDVPNEVKEIAPDFWKDWRKFVKEINPETYIVGEIWDDASEYLQGDEFDSVMNYRFRDAVLRFIGLGEIDASEFANNLSKLHLQYPEQSNYVMLNLIDSHDTTRYLTVIDEDKERLKLTVLFQMTYLGVPMVYYGDEIGMKGKDGSDCRRTMIWEDRGYTKPDYDLFEHYQKLIKIRKKEIALCRGNMQHMEVNNKWVYAFKRKYQNQKILVIINAGNEEANINLNLKIDDGKYEELYSEERVKVKDGKLEVTLDKVSGAIVKTS